jgi:hypothetical protein
MEHQAFAQLLGNYGEFVGAIAVVITLLYLAVQIRQNTESLRLSSELALSQQTSDFAARMWAHPEMLRIWDLVVTDPSSLSIDEIGQFRWVCADLFLVYEGQYQLYKRGHVAEDVWKGKADMMCGLLESPIVSEWWSPRMAPLTDDFVHYIESRPNSNGWKHQSVSGVS